MIITLLINLIYNIKKAKILKLFNLFKFLTYNQLKKSTSVTRIDRGFAEQVTKGGEFTSP